MNINSFFIGAALLFIATAANAQNDKKEKTPVYNYVIDDPMDAFGRQPAPTIIISPLIFPEFYSYMPIKIKDTLLKYECYDVHDELLNVGTLQDFNVVKYISVFKSFTDHAHTYIDSMGKEQPLPVSSIICRYDKTGNDKWLSVNYANNKYTNLVEHRNEIVKYDTIPVVDPVKPTDANVVFRYYKVVQSK